MMEAVGVALLEEDADVEEAASGAPKNAAADDDAELDDDDDGGNWASWSCTRLFASSIADAQLDWARVTGVAASVRAARERDNPLLADESAGLGSLGGMAVIAISDFTT